MNIKHIIEARKKFNIHEEYMLDYIDELNLWIIGRFGIIDIFEEGIKYEQVTISDFPSIDASSRADIDYYFLPYIDESDAIEGFCVRKFKIPWIVPKCNTTHKNIFFIKCTNNGISYFACDTIAALHSFVRYAINYQTKDSIDNGYFYARGLGWYLISGYGYDAIECWPSDTEWVNDNELQSYAQKLYPELNEDFAPTKLKSLCRFNIPFWDGGVEIQGTPIYAIRTANDGTYFASPNRHALRPAVTCLNGWRNQHIEETVQKEMEKAAINDRTTIVVNGDLVLEKHVEHEVGNVEKDGIGIQNNYIDKKKETDKSGKGRTDCCFFYNNNEYFSVAIQQFTNILLKHKLVPEDMDLKKMESLFLGKPCRRKYTWLGKPHILTHIIKGLTKADKPIITTWPEGTSPWEVVSCRFIDEEGYPLPNIRQENKRKKTNSIVEEAVNALAGYL